MKAILLTITLLICTHLCYAQFQSCIYSPSDNELHDVYFMDENTGIAVGEEGTILRSVDGGLIWSRRMSDSTITFKKVKFFDSKVGIALGTHMYKTIDGGVSWSPLNIANDKFIDIEILNTTTCLITGVPTALMKSTDQGETWNVLVSENFRNSEYGEYDYGLLSFLDENLGYNISHGFSLHPKIFKTEDGGLSWDTIYREVLLNPNSEISTIDAFSFTEENIGFKGGWYNPVLLKTTDGGVKWDGLWAENPSDFWIAVNDFHIEANQPNAYFACGVNNKIVKSTDQGENWNLMDIDLEEKKHFNGIFFINDTLGWAVGSNGVIFTTKPINHNTIDLELKVFPNPTNDLVNIYCPRCSEISECRLTDIEGRLLKSLKQVTEIDLSDYPTGVYFLKVITDQGELLQKIIKH